MYDELSFELTVDAGGGTIRVETNVAQRDDTDRLLYGYLIESRNGDVYLSDNFASERGAAVDLMWALRVLVEWLILGAHRTLDDRFPVSTTAAAFAAEYKDTLGQILSEIGRVQA